MNTKLEVVKTVFETIRFSFTKLPMTIRLGWLGFVLAALLLVVILGFGFGAIGGFEFIESLEALEDAEDDPAVVFGFIAAMIGFYFSLFLWIIIACLLLVPFVVALKQVAAGTIEPPSGIAYFRFGGRELRFVGANILYTFIDYIVSAILFIPAVIVFFFGLFGALEPGIFDLVVSDPDAFEDAIEASIGNGEGIALVFGQTALAALVGLILYVWFAVRFSIFTSAAAIENNLAPFGAVGLTGGNFWRIVGAYLLLWLMLMVIETVVLGAMFIGGGISGIALIPLFQSGEAGAMAGGIGLAVLFGIVYLALFLFSVTVQVSFPAKIYASLTRHGGGDDGDDAVMATEEEAA